MFTRLLESGTKSKKGEGWLTASAAFHVALLIGAVVLTPRRDAYSEPPDDEIHYTYVDDPAVKDVPHRGSTRPARNDGSPGSPIPTITGPIIDGIPDPLPDVGGNGLLSDSDVIETGTGQTSLSGVPGGPMSAATVDKPAMALPGNPLPVFPGMLRTAGIEGSVTTRFVIDTSGRVEQGTVVVMRSDHELFSSAVRAALVRSQFMPAEAGGRKVRMLVEQRFDFAIDE